MACRLAVYIFVTCLAVLMVECLLLVTITACMSIASYSFSYANAPVTLLPLFITSLAKEVMFLVALVSLSVYLSVCLFVCLWTTLLKKLWMDWDEILWTGPE